MGIFKDLTNIGDSFQSENSFYLFLKWTALLMETRIWKVINAIVFSQVMKICRQRTSSDCELMQPPQSVRRTVNPIQKICTQIKRILTMLLPWMGTAKVPMNFLLLIRKYTERWRLSTMQILWHFTAPLLLERRLLFCTDFC